MTSLNGHPAVLWPPHKHDLMLDRDSALWLVQRMAGMLPGDEDVYPEPTQEEIDEWMISMLDSGEVTE